MFSQLSWSVFYQPLRLWSSSCPPSTANPQLPSLVFSQGDFTTVGWFSTPSPTAPACSTEPVWGVVSQAAEQTQINTVTSLQEPEPTNSSQQLKPFWATQHKHQVSNIHPWHGISLKNLLLGPVIPCLPDYLKIKRNQHLSTLSQAWANHSQAAAITGPKRFQTDLLHILFNNHHFFKDFFFFLILLRHILLIGRKSI